MKRKDFIDLLERNTLGFRERKEDMEEHGDVKDTKDDVGLPLNVLWAMKQQLVGSNN